MEETSNIVRVLDKGSVELYSVMGSDLTVVNAARVSFNKRKSAFDVKDHKLINYLADHDHWTPFAHPQITVVVKCPDFVRVQLFKHKVGFVENEESRRYVDYLPEYYVPNPFRLAPTGNRKQGSSEEIVPLETVEKFKSEYITSCDKSLETYKNLIDMGMAPEIARGVLPKSAYVQFFWTGSLMAFARVYRQRIDTHAQYETREYAKAFARLIKPHFPESWRALTREDRIESIE